MSHHDETQNSPEEHQKETPFSPETSERPENDQEDQKSLGLIERGKQLYEDHPVHFAFGVMGVSGLLLLLGGVVSGDITLGAL